MSNLIHDLIKLDESDKISLNKCNERVGLRSVEISHALNQAKSGMPNLKLKALFEFSTREVYVPSGTILLSPQTICGSRGSVMAVELKLARRR